MNQTTRIAESRIFVTLLAALALSVGLVLAGCGSAAGTDAGTDAGADAGIDAGSGWFDAGFGVVYVAKLTTSQTVPLVSGSATGWGRFVLDNTLLPDGGSILSYDISFSDLTGPVTGAMVHKAPGGAKGGMGFNLGGAVQTSPLRGYASLKALGTELNAGRLYVNIHTGANPPGELRGQILRPGESLATAILSGANELPPTVVDAGGSVAFITSGATVRYDGLWPAIADAADAGLYQGGPGASAGALIGWLWMRPDGGGALGSFPATDLSGGDGGFYVNLHTTDAGTGLVRGQVVWH